MSAEMERWRDFFAQAEGDLWTIIEQAILIAATDFPAEFKHKRCEIAEVLFARRPIPLLPSRSIEAARFSGSVITSATADAEKLLYQARTEEANGITQLDASRIDMKVPDAQSLESASKDSGVDGYYLHDDKSVEHDRCLKDCNGAMFPPRAGGISMHSGVMRTVAMIKDHIMHSTSQTEDELLSSLHTLERLDISVEILKATDIGREVNKFRKHSSASVRNLVKQLVRTWKGIVDEWVRSSECGMPLKGREHEANETEVRFVNSNCEVSAARSLQLPEGQSLCTSITDRRVKVSLPDEHVIEEMGSSRVEPDELYKSGFVERKEWCPKQAHITRSEAKVKTQSGSIGPGRAVKDIPEFERAFVKGSEYEIQKGVDERHSTSYKRGDSQNSGQGKFMKSQDVSAEDFGRLESTKRKFSSEDQFTEYGAKLSYKAGKVA
ncbi:hypothetical protein KP509_23G045200 [Ceratopteris richardii]|uniref:TFIIS N-terminal domain-containing protein n=1 Tax=Ceratopteris richardii TaxID=49495 RepID=A0A8T2S1J9_CERRI|nr:hypothetical protein KP509_23G045200 [Ceratopteris richardii]